MEISKGVEMLQLDFHGNVIHPILLRDQEMTVLIDTGFPGQIEELCAAMAQVGVSFDELKVIILTHQDIDHIGNLPELLQAGGSNIKVYAHDLDKPYIQGDLSLLKDGHIENPPKAQWTLLWKTAKNYLIAVEFVSSIRQGIRRAISAFI